ncbi:beta-galactosidase [Clostridium boliviensis]|uniref:Beta-galactosidase n=1 Tax=Clostridium boliviensis TaxID=318465 RepID=A0ABU4GLA2_9CLOT|nr:beta-galactosidase [Clostridium boliviensis]MDW2797728.1 beta-galactosidase [Clostridium boliviensis]
MNKKIIMSQERLLHGGDYNPEQWLDSPDILKRDLELFLKAGINTVTMGMFSWALLEPEEGRYQIDWLTEIVDQLYQKGIYTILGTPSGARPQWLAKRYPEVLRVDEKRQRNLFGGRQNHCYTSPVYRQKVRKINVILAKELGSHPGVLLIHLSNEYGGDCHCPLCQEKFRGWLKERYDTIEELNRRWSTTFWGHTYQSFEQIESPSSKGELLLHALNLDWKRFVTAQTVDFAAQEKKAIRDGGCQKPVTTNFMGDYDGLNYRKFKGVIDVASWDSYPEWHRKPVPQTAAETAFQHDFMRSLLKKPFLLMESSPSSTNWQEVSKLRKPGILHAASLQAVAHGSDSVLYFQLRQSRGASEKFHGAVIDHYGGEDTRVFQEVCQVGETLGRLSELAGTVQKPKVALIWDTENRWALFDSQGPRNAGIPYKETAEKMYAGMRRLGLDMDIIDMEDDLENYRIVLIPMLYLFRGGIGDKIREFVKNGGTAVMTFWSGVADDTDRCFLGGVPGKLTDVFGLRRTEIDGLYEGEENAALPVKDNFLSLERRYTCRNLCELVNVSDARVLMTYEKDFYKDLPVVTCNQYGKGKAYYICADMEQQFYNDFLEAVQKNDKIEKPLPDIPDGVEVTTRESEEATYVLIQNFNADSVNLKLPDHGCEVIYGETEGSLKGLSSVIIKI